MLEQTKDATNYDWATGYGTPCNIMTIKKIIDTKTNDIIIPTIDELNIDGKDIVDDANSLFDYVNRSSDKEFVLQRIKK